MKQQMQADVLFLAPADASTGTAVLIEHGFGVEHLADWIDEAGPTVFFRIRITTDIDEDHFLDWVQSIIEQFDGDVVEAGLADPQQAA